MPAMNVSTTNTTHSAASTRKCGMAANILSSQSHRDSEGARCPVMVSAEVMSCLLRGMDAVASREREGHDDRPALAVAVDEPVRLGDRGERIRPLDDGPDSSVGGEGEDLLEVL